ncbi:MAG TPA: hypothetical protein VNB94_09545 [Mycobacteriales bacterium]|nr:hypothetical protein [Mycobacteriales bacterium]
MRRLAVLLVLLGLTGLPAAWASPAEVLVLRGVASRSMNLVLRRPTTFEVGGLGPARAMSARMGGTFAGFVVHRADGSVAVGGVVAAGFSVDSDQVPMVFGGGFDAVRLPAGRYRVTLLANGPSEVRVPAKGLGRSVTLLPRGRADVRGELVRQTLPMGVPTAVSRIPMTVTLGSMVVLASAQSYSAGVVSADDVCLARPGSQCATGGVSGGTGVVVAGAPGRLASIQALYFYPGQTPAASYEAVFVSTGAGAAERLVSFALRIG